MKTTVINIRVDEQTRESLEAYALEKQIKLSEYIRNALIEHIECVEEEKQWKKEMAIPDRIVIKVNFINKRQFTQLVTWLFAKYMFPVEKNPKSYLEYLKSLIQGAMESVSMSPQLQLEFNKVLHEVNTILIDPDYKQRNLKFPIPNTYASFDYVLMINEILNSKSNKD